MLDVEIANSIIIVAILYYIGKDFCFINQIETKIRYDL